jgi:hypothetical protein
VLPHPALRARSALAHCQAKRVDRHIRCPSQHPQKGVRGGWAAGWSQDFWAQTTRLFMGPATLALIARIAGAERVEDCSSAVVVWRRDHA